MTTCTIPNEFGQHEFVAANNSDDIRDNTCVGCGITIRQYLIDNINSSPPSTIICPLCNKEGAVTAFTIKVQFGSTEYKFSIQHWTILEMTNPVTKIPYIVRDITTCKLIC